MLYRPLRFDPVANRRFLEPVFTPVSSHHTSTSSNTAKMSYHIAGMAIRVCLLLSLRGLADPKSCRTNTCESTPPSPPPPLPLPSCPYATQLKTPRAIGTILTAVGGAMASMGGDKNATTKGPVPVTEDKSIMADSKDEEDLWVIPFLTLQVMWMSGLG